MDPEISKYPNEMQALQSFPCNELVRSAPVTLMKRKHENDSSFTQNVLSVSEFKNYSLIKRLCRRKRFNKSVGLNSRKPVVEVVISEGFETLFRTISMETTQSDFVRDATAKNYTLESFESSGFASGDGLIDENSLLQSNDALGNNELDSLEIEAVSPAAANQTNNELECLASELVSSVPENGEFSQVGENVNIRIEETEGMKMPELTTAELENGVEQLTVGEILGQVDKISSGITENVRNQEDDVGIVRESIDGLNNGVLNRVYRNPFNVMSMLKNLSIVKSVGLGILPHMRTHIYGIRSIVGLKLRPKRG
ncbi:hypothetical protein HK098_003439 [Nowakowskiella sp. JEL0407]|nr:hypothetical protein HK098_003439 [Nowakowskiella sp. JEL0407]